MFDVPSAYEDLTYALSGNDRPNPSAVSEQIMHGPNGLPSYHNRSVLFTFFGQMVSYEIINTAQSGCPAELLKVQVLAKHGQKQQTSNSYFMPFIRSDYDKNSGLSPNNPRKPINQVTSWIDGSFVYGINEVWSTALRSFKGGKLQLYNNSDFRYPARNSIRLPLDNYPRSLDLEVAVLEDLWMFGDSHVHQNPGLMTIALVWFRYHNYLASQIEKLNPTWSDEKVFQAARRKLIAVMQNIIVYEWLPILISENISLYQGYKNYIQPSISAVFEAAAFRIGHSMVPSGFYTRNAKCNYHHHNGHSAIRMCNTYWRSQKLISEVGMESFLLGMISQISEREDHILVEDLREKLFGPLHFSRSNLAIMTIMRGRDHGLPGYQTVRTALGLSNVTDWENINPSLYKKDPMLFRRLRDLHGSIDKLDVFTGGLLESSAENIGSLFKTVIKDQFERIRDGDRYWFENTKNKLFSEAEIKSIRQMTFYDVLIAIGIEPFAMQKNVFIWKAGDPCPQPSQLNSNDLEVCTPRQFHDYFWGSEVSYIASYVCLALVPFGCVMAAYFIARWRQSVFDKRRQLWKMEEMQKSSYSQNGYISAIEVSTEEKFDGRLIHISLNKEKCRLIVLSHENKALRVVDFAPLDVVELWAANDELYNLLLFRLQKECDLIVRFVNKSECTSFISSFDDFLTSVGKKVIVSQMPCCDIFNQAMTKVKRQQLLEKFFRQVFAQANETSLLTSPELLNLDVCKEIMDCELSRVEFADALSLQPDSSFVESMFSIIDRDSNGYISFRELLYAVLLFAKGTCEEKLQLLFKMYDKDESGSLSREEVSNLIKSLMEMANKHLSSDNVEQLVNNMFVTAGLERRTSLKFEEFTEILDEHMNMLWDVCIDWKGTKVCLPKKKKVPTATLR